MKKTLLIPLILLLFLSACENKEKKSDTTQTRLTFKEYEQEEWYKAFAENKLIIAESLLVKKLEKHPQQLPTLTYYAELLRRTNRHLKADSVADIVLSLDSTDGDAYQIKGDMRNLQYGRNPVYNKDNTSALTYYMQGIKKDSTNGNLWELILFIALEQNNKELYTRGLKRLYTDGHFTKTALSLAKLYLMNLPENAILLTAGDMDTYPLLAVQEGENFRKDVLILNSNLLNLAWYFTASCEMAELNHGLTKEQIEAVAPEKTPDGKYIYPNTQFIQILQDAKEKGLHKRPLSALIFMPSKVIPTEIHNKHMVVKGYHKEYVESYTGLPIDFSNIRKIRDSLIPENFVEPFVSHTENSPILLQNRVRRNNDLNILSPLLQAIVHHMNSQKVAEAEEILSEVKNYLKVVKNKEKRVASIVEKISADIEKIKAKQEK